MLRRSAQLSICLLTVTGALAAPSVVSAQAPATGPEAQLDLDLDLSGDDGVDDLGPETDTGDDDTLDDAPDDDGTGEDATGEVVPPLPTTSLKVVPGRKGALRPDGKAAIPRDAPKRVRAIIRAANRIVGKPYKWGGGHARKTDAGYDCSGAISYALMRAGLQRRALVSGGLARAFSGGAGKWVTVYATRRHAYMEVAGLRLDTSPYGDPAGRSGVRWRPVVGARTKFRVRHPAGL